MEPHDDLSPALQALLDRFRGMVRAVGWRHGLADHELDELMQAIRLRLWHARGSPEQIEATPASYVYRTATTAALDLIRARRTLREEPIDMVHDHGGIATAESAEAAVEGAELVSLVARAVDEIIPSRRPVLRMYLAGYDREEIAGLLGWTEAKTRNLLYRGLADLRGLLTARGLGPESAA
jgi:RNA polymerase sigma-70 factor (ECF subfamily)